MLEGHRQTRQKRWYLMSGYGDRLWYELKDYTFCECSDGKHDSLYNEKDWQRHVLSEITGSPIRLDAQTEEDRPSLERF